MVEYRPLELGARPMAGRLTLDQQIGVRLLCPQLTINPRQSEGFFNLKEFKGCTCQVQFQVYLCV